MRAAKNIHLTYIHQKIYESQYTNHVPDHHVNQKIYIHVILIWNHISPRGVEQSVMWCTVKALCSVRSPVRNPWVGWKEKEWKD